MSSKALIIVCIFVCLNSIAGIQRSEVIRSICRGNWTQTYNFRTVVAIMPNDNNDNRFFHLTRDKCQNITEPKELKFPDKMTSYLSMKRKYLFLYITINQMISKNHSNFKINFNQNWINDMKSKFLLVVWLKETSNENFKNLIPSYKYGYEIKTINIGNQPVIKKITNFNNSDLNSKQILLDEQWLDTSTSSLKFEIQIMATNLSPNIINENITINDSYIVFCAQSLNKSDMLYSMSKCSPKLRNEYLICKCIPEDQEYVSFTIALLWLVFALFLVIQLLKDAFKSRNDNNLYVFSNCNYRNTLFHYKITLRLGKVTKNFNLRNSVIDIQFYSSEKESLIGENPKRNSQK